MQLSGVRCTGTGCSQELVFCEDDQAVKRYVYICRCVHFTYVEINATYTRTHTYAANWEKAEKLLIVVASGDTV